MAVTEIDVWASTPSVDYSRNRKVKGNIYLALGYDSDDGFQFKLKRRQGQGAHRRPPVRSRTLEGLTWTQRPRNLDEALFYMPAKRALDVILASQCGPDHIVDLVSMLVDHQEQL